MKMVLQGIRQLTIEETGGKQPVPGKGQKYLKVLSCAICRTDAKMWAEGHRDLVFPRVPGHEMVVADEAGARYAVWPGESCGVCRFCRHGHENLCEDMKITGFHNDGGFSDRILLGEKSLIALPADLDTHAACFTEPVGCVINAFEKLVSTPNGRVLIFGGGTMGLIAALYAKDIGLTPLIIEKYETKIEKITPVLAAAGIAAVKETHDSEFDLIVNACPDFIAFCQGIIKVVKGGQLSFFSGLSKNEHIETNLLNLLHYKEVKLAGAYGLTRANMRDAIIFIQKHTDLFHTFIEAVIPPRATPDLMAEVLSGHALKYIIDFSLTADADDDRIPRSGGTPGGTERLPKTGLPANSLGQRTLRQIEPVSDTLLAAAIAKIDNKTKPLGALGVLEKIAVKMSCIQQNLSPDINRKQLLVFAADHGITEEGVSAYPAEVTGQMVANFLNGGAAINVLCRHHQIDMKVLDIGVKSDFSDHPELIRCKVNRGTRNFAIGDAMRPEEMQQALEQGMQTFFSLNADKPIDIIGLGEMGIGNTTAASAIIATVTGLTPSQVTGRGTGIDDQGLRHKAEVIEKALNFHSLDGTDGFEILTKIGGFEIAGMAGTALAAASKGVPVVLDGLISTAAGLIAYRINPAVQGYLFSGHKSVEKAQQAALTYMNLEPLIDFQMRLGEGTGAALAINVIEAACKIMTQMASFDDAHVSRS